MRMTVLAYSGLGETLTVEFSLAVAGPDGVELPLKFMGRTHVAGEGLDEAGASSLAWRVAKVLSEMAMDLADYPTRL